MNIATQILNPWQQKNRAEGIASADLRIQKQGNTHAQHQFDSHCANRELHGRPQLGQEAVFENGLVIGKIVPLQGLIYRQKGIIAETADHRTYNWVENDNGKYQKGRQKQPVPKQDVLRPFRQGDPIFGALTFFQLDLSFAEGGEKTGCTNRTPRLFKGLVQKIL